MLENDDLWILDKIKEFASSIEAVAFVTARRLILLVEHIVSLGL